MIYGAAKIARRTARALDSVIVAHLRARRAPIALSAVLEDVRADWGSVSNRAVLRRLAHLTKRRRVRTTGRNPRRRYEAARV